MINEFAKISQLVNTIVTRYRTTCKECGFADDERHSKTIERIAKPFLKGHFTLAVVGKVSSGKSTFINALLESKGLLPTGHDQTTCGITYIEYGDSPEATITFGDGHKTSIKNDIAGQIHPYVAIPEKYHDLPVNHIDSMILGGFDFKKIWDARKQLEKETLCAKIDKDLLIDYVSHRKMKDIAIEVRMKFPFNEALKGWRIVDTPGIGAIGGLEENTQKLLAIQKDDGSHEVDAIIFLQDGSQTLDQLDTKKFVQEQLDNFTESDKRRLFFVLTHSASLEFLEHKESKLNTIRKYYGDKIKCLAYVDSLLYSFISFIDEHDIDLEMCDDIEKPEGWAKDEWNAILSILYNAKRDLKNDGDAVNNETILRRIKAWANFDILKSEINLFARNEKLKVLYQLVTFIANDYEGYLQQFQKYNQLISGDLSGINKAIDELKDKRKDYSDRIKQAERDYSINELQSRFQFIDQEIEKFDDCLTIPEVRKSVTDLFDNVQRQEKALCNEIKKTYADVLKGHDDTDIFIDSIDFESIEQEAIRKSTEPYVISPAIKETILFCHERIRVPAKYGTRVNDEKKIKEFKALTKMRARNDRDSFLLQFNQKIQSFQKIINEELNKKLTEEKVTLEDLRYKLTDKELTIAQYNERINKLYKAQAELAQQVKENGYEYK